LETWANLPPIGYAPAFRRWTPTKGTPLDVGMVCGGILKKILATCVSVDYTHLVKDSGLRIRIERDLRERFLEICREQDRPAAQFIREFMRGYISQYEADKRNDKNKKASR
jgi:hypothetical protein